MKVFIVEDSLHVRERLRSLLQPIPGVDLVGEAVGVDEAVRGILSSVPDLVLLDIQLGGASGFEVLKAVHWREPEIGFYMLSNFATEPYRRHAARLGASGFFDKTIEFERVRDLVAERSRAATRH